MTAFTWRAGVLHAEAVALPQVAQAVGTPVYVYAAGAIACAYDAYAAALAGIDAQICYALKANGNLAVVRTLAQRGAGADVVSGGELTRALAAGVPADRIVFAGVGKTEAELRLALSHRIGQINVESAPELAAVEAAARALGTTAPVALRLNPDVDAVTHAKITTGRQDNKFGIDLEQALALIRRRADWPHVRIGGLAMHIGSQLLGLEPFRAAFAALAAATEAARAEGAAIDRLDVGGGLGIAYAADTTPPALSDYAALVRDLARRTGCRLILEPGRSLVGNAGVLLTRVVYIKDGASRRFVIVDAGMNDLLRPALYDAHHEVHPVWAADPGALTAPVDLVGPVCESADTFAWQRPLPPLAPGALLAIFSVGAYGAVMASGYNARPLVPEVLVRGGDYAVVRRRQSVEEHLALESVPAWLADPWAGGSGSADRG